MGGGAQNMGVNVEPIGPKSCVRTDGRNLADEWQVTHPNGKYVNNTQDLMSIDIANTSHILGLFSPDHLPYHAVKTAETPSLVNMTTQAIKLLKKNKNGFLLMVSALFAAGERWIFKSRDANQISEHDDAGHRWILRASLTKRNVNRDTKIKEFLGN